MQFTLNLFLIFLLIGCSSQPMRGQSEFYPPDKIRFRLDNIRTDGLRGQPDGLVSVAYEFCVPDNENVYQELIKIDPSLKIYKGSPGRIGCKGSQSLCIGETNQPHWREVLQALSSLEYIDEIRQSFFE
jgi:hypothetical protein